MACLADALRADDQLDAIRRTLRQAQALKLILGELVSRATWVLASDVTR